eukprot:TRINITY_DN6062_c0_g2_i2.p1 TRINITY_DN6062_c0_g2~~TRINITY_DN6062_c0_g2_i2.p1  ORF type:complete len:754 (+),score=164.08 TRINITY_DN6062_c0_g2_i2:127-2262(+)
MAAAAVHVTKKTDTTTHYFATELANREQIAVGEPLGESGSPVKAEEVDDEARSVSDSESCYTDDGVEQERQFKVGEEVKTPDGVGAVQGMSRGRVGVSIEGVIKGYPVVMVELVTEPAAPDPPDTPKVQRSDPVPTPPPPPENPTPEPQQQNPTPPRSSLDDQQQRLIQSNMDLERQLIVIRKALADMKPTKRVDPTTTVVSFRTEGLERQAEMYRKENEYLQAKLASQEQGPSQPILKEKIQKKEDEVKGLKAENRKFMNQLKIMEHKLTAKEKLEEAVERRRADNRAEEDLMKIKLKKAKDSKAKEHDAVAVTAKVLKELHDKIEREGIKVVDTKAVKDVKQRLADSANRVELLEYQISVVKKSHHAEKLKLQRSIKSNAVQIIRLKSELQGLKRTLDAKQHHLSANLCINRNAKTSSMRHSSGNKLQPLPQVPSTNSSSTHSLKRGSSTPLSSLAASSNTLERDELQPRPPSPTTPKTNHSRKHHARQAAPPRKPPSTSSASTSPASAKPQDDPETGSESEYDDGVLKDNKGGKEEEHETAAGDAEVADETVGDGAPDEKAADGAKDEELVTDDDAEKAVANDAAAKDDGNQGDEAAEKAEPGEEGQGIADDAAANDEGEQVADEAVEPADETAANDETEKAESGQETVDEATGEGEKAEPGEETAATDEDRDVEEAQGVADDAAAKAGAERATDEDPETQDATNPLS